MTGEEGDGMEEQGWKEDIVCPETNTRGSLGQWLHHWVVELGTGASASQGHRQGAEQLPGEGDCGRGGERATIGTRCPQKLMT